MSQVGVWLDRLGRWFRDLCVILVVALLMAYGVELLARRGLVLPDHDEYMRGHAVFSHQPWGPQYIEDVRGYRWLRLYKDYVGFRQAPYNSATINIGKDGLRITPDNCDRPDAKLVYAFGGSTMLGVGAPDASTIPSNLARLLNQGGSCVKLVNFGGGWWQSSQELAQFIVRLREGERPVAAFFYDGVNDIDAVSFGGKVGGTDPGAEPRFNSSAELSADRISLRRFLYANSTALNSIDRIMNPPLVKDAGNPFRLTQSQIEAVAPQIVGAYEANVRMIQAIARQFDVPVFFFLQPFPLISSKSLTPDEAQMRRGRLENRDWEPQLVSETYEIWRNSPYLKRLPNFFDVSLALDQTKEEVFADAEHLLPRGNEIMANIIVEQLRSIPSLSTNPGPQQQ